MHYKMTLRLLEGGKPFFGPGVMELAEYIEQGLSLRQAAGKMGMAYSKAWRIITEFEDAAGYPLVEMRRGGAGGGGATLTAEGAAFVKNYREFQERTRRFCDGLFQECFDGGKRRIMGAEP